MSVLQTKPSSINQSFINVRSILLIFFITCFGNLFSQDEVIIPEEKKVLNIKRTNKAPKIDGVLDDDVWTTADIATDFTHSTDGHFTDDG